MWLFLRSIPLYALSIAVTTTTIITILFHSAKHGSAMTLGRLRFLEVDENFGHKGFPLEWVKKIEDEEKTRGVDGVHFEWVVRLPPSGWDGAFRYKYILVGVGEEGQEVEKAEMIGFADLELIQLDDDYYLGTRGFWIFNQPKGISSEKLKREFAELLYLEAGLLQHLRKGSGLRIRGLVPIKPGGLMSKDYWRRKEMEKLLHDAAVKTKNGYMVLPLG